MNMEQQRYKWQQLRINVLENKIRSKLNSKDEKKQYKEELRELIETYKPFTTFHYKKKQDMRQEKH